MACKTIFIRAKSSIGRRRAAFTLVEILVATGVASVVMLGVLSFAFFSNRSFASLTNYMDLDQRTQSALDKMSQQIRQVDSLTAFSSTNLIFQDYDGGTLQYAYDSQNQTLTRTKSGATETLLTGCDFLQFSIFQRSPSNATFLPFSTASVASTKVIELTWNCSRKILGSTANNESMQSAKIVIRKK